MNSIYYPSSVSEFEIQAYLFAKLRDIGLDCRGEVLARYYGDGARGKAICRFDLVLFKDKQALLIIEVKNSPHKPKRGPTRQTRRYSQYGVDVVYVHSYEEADDLVSMLSEAEQVER